jgi:Uma2 family endonuclease
MNVAFSHAIDEISRRAFTVADIRRMVEAGILAEDERVELVEGDLVKMAAKGFAHELVKNSLVVAIAKSLPDHLRMGVETTLRLTETVLLEPDIAVFPALVFQKPVSDFVQLDPGQAHLVIEVAHSSLSYDKGLKAALYARHRVREFWVIDANERITWVHSGPQGDGWSSIVQRGPDETLTTASLPGFAVQLSSID